VSDIPKDGRKEQIGGGGGADEKVMGEKDGEGAVRDKRGGDEKDPSNRKTSDRHAPRPNQGNRRVAE